MYRQAAKTKRYATFVTDRGWWIWANKLHAVKLLTPHQHLYFVADFNQMIG